jgi:hypothetical protein
MLVEPQCIVGTPNICAMSDSVSNLDLGEIPERGFVEVPLALEI